MSHINEKIAYRKHAIHQKKQNISNELTHLKQTLGLPSSIGLKTIGGLLLGFMLVPKKLKVLKLTLKAVTIATTAKQLLDLIPHQSGRQLSKRTPHTRKNNVTPIRRKT
jgi:hypothetical protein